MSKRILAVCQDDGGTNGILAVVPVLRTMGHQLVIGCKKGSRAATRLEGKDKELFIFPPDSSAYIMAASVGLGGELEHMIKSFDLLLTSMCSGGGIGRELIPTFKSLGKPTVALTDYPLGAQLRPFFCDPRYQPRFVCVNDGIEADLIRRAWNTSPEFIKITGYPAFDKYAALDVEAEEARVRKALGMDRLVSIVLLAGQFPLTDFVAWEVVHALNVLDGELYFLPRPHPRTRENAAHEIPGWQRAMAGLSKSRLIVDFFGQFATDPAPLVAAAQLVISPYSTMLAEAAALRKDNIALLYPKLWAQLTSVVPDLEEFPLVSLGCTARANNQAELRNLLYKSLSGGLGLRGAQEKHFKLDGQNARRVAEFVASVLL